MEKKLQNIKRPQVEEVEDVAEKILPVKKEAVVTNCDVLRVRKDHEKNAEVITTIPAGTVVVIDGDAVDGFFNIATIDGIFGWCMKEFLKTV